MTTDQVLLLFEAGSQWATSDRLAIAGGRLLANQRSGSPFILAARIEAVNGNPVIIANGDNADSERVPGGNYDNGRIQRNLFSRMERHPRVPFSALNMAGLPLEGIRLVDHTFDQLGDWIAVEVDQCDDGIRLAADSPDDATYQSIGGWLANADGDLLNEDLKTADECIPMGALRTINRSVFVEDQNGPSYNNSTGTRGWNKPRSISWHRVGTVVLRLNDKDYLCAMDERQYFISLLPEQVDSVSNAFAALAPQEVKDFIRLHHSNPRRQGEWFFIPVETGVEGNVKLSDLKGDVKLPRESEQSNLHVASEGVEIDGVLYVRGEVKHMSPDGTRESGEHGDLFLGPTWHRVAKNTSVADWTVPQDSSRAPMVD